jgi:hypothetical protein
VTRLAIPSPGRSGSTTCPANRTSHRVVRPGHGAICVPPGSYPYLAGGALRLHVPARHRRRRDLGRDEEVWFTILGDADWQVRHGPHRRFPRPADRGGRQLGQMPVAAGARAAGRDRLGDHGLTSPLDRIASPPLTGPSSLC